MKTKQEKLEVTDQSIFYKLFNSSPDSMIVIDNNESINLINKSTENLFGYTREEILGKSVNIIIPERYRSKFQSYVDSFFNNSLSKPIGLEMDLHGLKKDGSEFPIEVNLGWVDLNGNTVIISTIRDLSDRKRLEKELRKSYKILEQKIILKAEENDKVNSALKTALENNEMSQKNMDKIFALSNDMIGITNADGYFIHLNSNWIDFLGWTLDELAAKPYIEFVHQDDQKLLKENIDKINEKNEFINLNLRMETKDEQFKEMIWKITGSNKNKSILILANSSQVKGSETQSIVNIINSIDEGITFSDKNGHFEIFNTGMEKITGYTIKDANNVDFSKLIYPDGKDRQNVLDGLNLVLESSDFVSSDTEIITKDGIKKYLIVSTKIIEIDGEKKFLSIYEERQSENSGDEKKLVN